MAERPRILIAGGYGVFGQLLARELLDTTNAALVLAGDLGCLMNIAGRLKRTGSGVRARHVAEVLAGDADATPAIGES